MSYYANMKTINSIARQVYAANHLGELDSFPEEITLTPTMHCNFNCVTCTQDHKDPREYPQSFIAQLEEILPFVKFVNINGGEPLLYKHLDELITTITAKETRFWLVTNGSLLNESWREKLVGSALQVIKFSIDGGTPQAYAAVRPHGTFFKVLGNIAQFMKRKITEKRHDVWTQFNFVALRDNIESLPKLAAIAAELGINQINVTYCVCFTPYLAERSLYFHQELSDEKIMLTQEIGDKYGVTIAAPKLFSGKSSGKDSWLDAKTCDFPFKYMAVELSGKIGICCGSSIRRGNIFENGFAATWNDPFWVKIRETVNTENETEMCRNCILCKQKPDNILSHIPDKELARRMLALHGRSEELAALAAEQEHQVAAAV